MRRRYAGGQLCGPDSRRLAEGGSIRRCTIDIATAPFILKVRMREKGRGGGDFAARVCDVDSRPGTLRSVPNGAPPTPPFSPADNWPLEPTAHWSPNAVRHGPQERATRERRDDHPKTASVFCKGRTAGENWAT